MSLNYLVLKIFFYLLEIVLIPFMKFEDDKQNKDTVCGIFKKYSLPDFYVIEWLNVAIVHL